MQKQMMNGTNASRLADAAFAASRQVWLAGLGAAAVTRQWAKNDAGHALRTLIKEGSVVESQAIRVIGNGVETSLATAGSLWSRTRQQLRATVTAFANTAAAALPQLKTVRIARKPSLAKPPKAAKKRVATRANHGARRTKGATRRTR